jgi:hypothetical protein
MSQNLKQIDQLAAVSRLTVDTAKYTREDLKQINQPESSMGLPRVELQASRSPAPQASNQVCSIFQFV